MPKYTRLGDVVDILTGNPFKSSGYCDDASGIRLLRGDNVTQGRIRWDNAKYWPVSEMSSYERFQLRCGDVILAMDRPWIEAGLKYAEIRSDDVPSLLVQRTACLRARNGLNQRYLSYLIGSQRFTDYILGVQTGTAVPHISAKQISDFSFDLPVMAAQEAIGQLLGALDDKISVNGRIADKARLLAQSRFQDLIGQPESGIEQELSSIAELVSRGITPRYSDESEQLVVLNQKCVRDGRISLGLSRRTQREMVPSHKLLRLNDVLVNSTGVGTLGRVARWIIDYPATVDSHVTIIRVDPEKADPVCAGFALLAAQQHIESLGEGSTGQTELSRAQLGALSLTIPNTGCSKRLRPILDVLEARGNTALGESATLSELRDALLPKLMSGEIRVREAERIVEGAT